LSTKEEQEFLVKFKKIKPDIESIHRTIVTTEELGEISKAQRIIMNVILDVFYNDKLSFEDTKKLINDINDVVIVSFKLIKQSNKG